MPSGLNEMLVVVLTVIAGFVVWAAFAPFETLGWWAGWFGDKIYGDDIPSDGVVRAVPAQAQAYVLFLSGIGRVSSHTFSYREQEFLRQLAIAVPGVAVIDDIFPYSVNNLSLTGQPIFAGLWRWSLARKRHGPAPAGYLINIRNIFQVGIALDHRYAPLYNQAVAEVFLDRLMRYQYDPTSQVPVYVIAYSGAAQMGIGAVTYLREWLAAPVYVISLGGIFGSDQGLLNATHLFHLWGTIDKAQIWRFIFPGRWSIFASSAWNRACRHGGVTIIPMQDMGHTGRGGYLDATVNGPELASNVQITVATIAGIIAGAAQRATEHLQPIFD